ncbi:uncharacterized protein LOC133530868 [Cydia pomonella]|uniref:uncharacterized protein LOC133530868 n=1 Tax=Cydia pomonella TaxID=82600 RepID=UPI002ADDA8FA|nr:uncharacterized protein LOC133530868 [Cydia pomonella]
MKSPNTLNLQKNSNSSVKIGPTDTAELKTFSVNIDFKISKENEKKETTLKANSHSDVANNSTDEAPKIIYKSSKLKRRTLKKTVCYKHSNKFKKTNKHNGIKNMNKKIKRCVARKDANLCEVLNQISPESLSELTSSCQILKQVPGKESLLDDWNLAEENIDENSEDFTPSLYSVDSMMSNYSQNTITHAIKTESSETDSLDRCSERFVINEPMKANIINVSRAQVDNISFGNTKSLDTLTGEVDLTDNIDVGVCRNDRVAPPTSKSIERDLFSDQTELFTSSEASVETLVDDGKKLRPFTENECFYQSSSNSFSQSSITLHVDNFDIVSNKKYAKISLSHTKTLMDTVNDMGMFPEMTGPRSSTTFNDVIVAERLITSFKLYKETKDKLNGNYNQTNDSKTKPLKSVAQNVDPVPKTNFKPKNIEKFPFNVTMNDSNTCTNECQSDKPSSLSELWENLTAALDTQLQKLEKSLTDTIIAETKMSLNILSRFMQFGSEKHNKVDIESNVNEVLNQLDEDLQCNILDGPVKPNVTNADVSLSGLLFNVTKEVQYNLKPSFEILKPAVKSAEDSLDVLSVEVDKPGPSASSSRHLRPSFSVFVCQ